MKNSSVWLDKLERLAHAPVLVAGDVMLDHFVYGDVHRISPEAPIPVLDVRDEKPMLGGAGNAARNLASLGAQVHFVSIAGDDPFGDAIGRQLDDLASGQHRLVREPGRRTTVKTRFVSHGQQLLRADVETKAPVSDTSWRELLTMFSAWLPRCRAVLLSDYAKGVLHEARAGALIRLAREAGTPVVVDPKGADFQRYRGATVIKPNLRELAEASRLSVSNTAEVVAAAERLVLDCACQFVLVTRGAEGMTLAGATGPARHWPSQAREVFDVSGAGDTVGAALAAALAAGLDIDDAVTLANCAAGIVVGKLGTATATRAELRAAISDAAASR
jgi:D-beta-D-heptose 7-phosphate kinase / D-beta-D-heptose 1-phosphate adenosyltransferase